MSGKTQSDWLAEGIKAGWCGPPVCSTHDGIPTTLEEDELWETEDPCTFVIRPYASAMERGQVEANHLPSVWRNEWTPRLRLVE